MRLLKAICSTMQKRKLKSSELHKVYWILRRAFGHQQWWPGDTPFEVMVGAILTQNTAWKNVEKAIDNLKRSNKLSFKSLRDISKRRLARLIRPAGYYNIKAERLKCFLCFLEQEFSGDLRKMKKQKWPMLREKLLQVKGIGPETADSILLYGLDKPSFVIDAYTKRIFSRHGLADFEENYEVWKSIFEKALPKKRELYNDFHAQIVKLGKDYCRMAPQCGNCPLKRFLH